MSFRFPSLLAASAAMLIGGAIPLTDMRPMLPAAEIRPTRSLIRRSSRPGGRPWGTVRGAREVARARRQHARILARREVRALVAARMPVQVGLLERANMRRPGGYRLELDVCVPAA